MSSGRDPSCGRFFLVGTLSITVNLSGESSWTTVRLPSPLEAKANLVPGSKALASSTLANRWRSDHLAAVGVDHDHNLFVASGEEAAVFAIHSEAGGTTCRAPWASGEFR